MIRFQFPELALLAIPAFFAFRRWGRAPGATGWIRLAVLVALLLALTGPELNVGGQGIDVVVVADRSRSMPPEAEDHLRELVQNLDRNRGTGDRVGIVTFGSRAHAERLPRPDTRLTNYSLDVEPDGSHLEEAVRMALDMIDRDRPARILVLSDGEATGGDPLSAARRAREEGVPVDYRFFERVRAGDIAVRAVELPESVAPREPFQFAAVIVAGREARGTVRLLREGKVLATKEADLVLGPNRVVFRDVLEAGGFYRYAVELDAPGDPLDENNRGEGVVRVEAGPRILVLNNDGRPGNLGRALQAAKLPVDFARAAEHPLTQDALDPYRAVVVENVPAGDLGRLKMEQLAQFVEDLGGGLLLTGGERSFGSGGYFNSPLEDVLPVSMELREEHRKNRVAIAIALDRSGSMTVPVAGGKTKMDLANLGTAECVNMLSAGDSVAVIAVDSSPHLIQPMTPIGDDKGAITSRIKKIQSMGGGIFVYDALVAAGKELAKADEYSTRHVILFSDAQDSEAPGDYINLLKKFEAGGITVSVIGLGKKTDRDGGLLEDIANRGSGNIMFTEDAAELPRLFTEDTMSVARSSFVKHDPETQPGGIPGELRLGEARLMGPFPSSAFPGVGGYNLTYGKPKATVAALSRDEYAAPWSAFWQIGLGRSAAITVEVDGKYSGGFATWDEYADFLVTHARWLLGGDRNEDAFVDVVRRGQDAVVTVELDPDRARSEPPQLVVVPPGRERQDVLRPDLVWTGPNVLEARFRMDRLGTYRTLVRTGERQLSRGPAVTLPYSPEFDPRENLLSGRETLEELAALSGGKARTDVLEVFADPPRAAGTRWLFPYLVIAGLSLLLVEIAGRRLSLWERVRFATAERRDGHRARWLPQWKLRLPGRKPRPAPAREPATTARAAQAPAPPPLPAAEPAARTSIDVYEQAKQRARRRMQ
ncbi:MAG: vWA domain-containing protein [Planctomycetales bacterium]